MLDRPKNIRGIAPLVATIPSKQRSSVSSSGAILRSPAERADDFALTTNMENAARNRMSTRQPEGTTASDPQGTSSASPLSYETVISPDSGSTTAENMF